MAQVSACNLVKRCSEEGDADFGGGEGNGGHEHSFGRKGRSYESGRERIRLGLGALRSQRSVWGMAGRSVREVSGVARELLGVKNSCSVVGGSSSGGSTGHSPEGYGGQEGRRGAERDVVVDVRDSEKAGEESFLDLLGSQDDGLMLIDGGSNGDEDGMRYMRFQDFEGANLEVSV